MGNDLSGEEQTTRANGNEGPGSFSDLTFLQNTVPASNVNPLDKDNNKLATFSDPPSLSTETLTLGTALSDAKYGYC
jgi:hypothetical protein